MAGEDAGDVVRRDRFSGGPARGFLSSLDVDERIFAADLAVDRAHVVMLAEQGIVEAAEAGAILEALGAVEAAGYDDLPAGEDVHAAIETAVIDRAGAVGGKLHTARSRNDEVATCLRHRFRADLLEAAEACLDIRGVLVGAAADHVETLMPGYTHLQPAQPTSLAHWLLSYEGALRRDVARLFAAFETTNRSPLGAAALAGTSFDVDRERTAALLGFDGVVENAMDAVSARDFLTEGLAGLAGVSITLSGLAEDVIGHANRGFVELDDDYASTSSIMPQKKNPDTLELVRATAGDAVGGLVGLLTTLKGLPRAYNRDLQAASPHAWAAADAVVAATTVAAGAVSTATWDEAAIAEAASEGFTTATAVAERLARAGLPFRTAHRVVAAAATRGGDAAALEAAAEAELGEPLSDVVDPAAIEAALDPEAALRGCDSLGGPAPAALEPALGRARSGLGDDRERLGSIRASLVASADDLETAVEAFS